MQPLDHAAIDLQDALVAIIRLCEGGDHPLGPGDRLRIGREGLIGGRDLARMDQRLAVEAHAPACRAFGGKALHIAEIGIDAVEDGQVVGFRRDDDLHHPGHQFGPVRSRFDARRQGNVVGPDDERTEPVPAALAGDRADVENAERRLDHRPELQPVRRVGFGQRDGGLLQHRNTLDLRQQDRIDPGAARHQEVFGAPLRVERVDPHDPLAREGGVLQMRAQALARRVLLVRGGGILEVVDQAVGGETVGFLQRAGVGAGDEEQRAAGAKGRGHGRCHGRFSRARQSPGRAARRLGLRLGGAMLSPRARNIRRHHRRAKGMEPCRNSTA